MVGHELAGTVKSMTGFARVRGSLPSVEIDLEVRSVNSRYLEVVLKGHQRMGSIERDARGILQKLHTRGRIELLFSRRVVAEKERSRLEDETIDVLVARYLATCKRYGASSDGLPSFIGSLVMRESSVNGDSYEVPDEEIALIKGLLEQASQVLAGSRRTEGASLVAEIQRRVEILLRCREALERQMSGAPERLKERLLERIALIAPEVKVDPERVALEVALLADRVDVTEELSRLRIHLGEFLSTLEKGSVDGVGRKLDFLTQEIGRELNTIGSKAQDASVQGLVVDSKAELERIREQVQNIE